VKTKTPGSYQVIYTVANQAGVTATKTTEVNVLMEGDAAITDATQLVETAEKSKLQKDVDVAKLFVAELPDGVAKDSLNARLTAVQKKIDDAKTAEDAAKDVDAATKAVEQAEQSKAQADVTNARQLVFQLSDDAAKGALNNRLNVVQKAIDDQVAATHAVAEATKAVEQAEQSLTQADADAAKKQINALGDSSAKSLLEKRLSLVQKAIDASKAPVQTEHTYYVVKGSYLYSAASGNKKRIGYIAVNARLKSKSSPNDRMLQVTYKGKTGYVYKVNLGSKALSVTRYVHKASYLYTTNMKNKHRGVKIPKNAKLKTKSALSSKMYQVTYKGKTGYVYRANLGKKTLRKH
jgi:ribosomal protein L21E